MTDTSTDTTSHKLIIRDLELQCLIGVEDWERRMTQKVIVDIELLADFSAAATSDDLTHALDYRTLCEKAAQTATTTEYHLLETLADKIATATLNTHERISQATVTVFKPLALASFGKAEARVQTTKMRAS